MRLGHRGAVLAVAIFAARLAQLTFVGHTWDHAVSKSRLARPCVDAGASGLRGQTRDECSAYCKEYSRYIDEKMFMTAAARLAARQDILMRELEHGTQKTLSPQPRHRGDLQLHLWDLEDQRHQPRVKVMQDEIFEVAELLRSSMTAFLKDQGMTSEMIKDLLAHVELLERQDELGPDIANVRRLIRMAAVCKGKKAVDMSDLEPWLEQEDNSVLSTFKTQVGDIVDPVASDPVSSGELQDFLDAIGPEFQGKAQTILDATGVESLTELVDLVDQRSDLADLDREGVGMKVLHVKKLFKAILREKERRASE